MKYIPIRDIDRTTGIVVIILAVGIFTWLSSGFLEDRVLDEPAEIHLDQEVLTLQMKPEILMDSINKNASQWCIAERKVPIIGDIVLKSVENGIETYDEVFLKDSVAPKMAAEYSRFEFHDKDGEKRFVLPATAGTVTVPAWLVRSLIEKKVLKLK